MTADQDRSEDPRVEAHALFCANLGLIDRVIDRVCHNGNLHGADAKDRVDSSPRMDFGEVAAATTRAEQSKHVRHGVFGTEVGVAGTLKTISDAAALLATVSIPLPPREVIHGPVIRHDVAAVDESIAALRAAVATQEQSVISLVGSIRSYFTALTADQDALQADPAESARP